MKTETYGESTNYKSYPLRIARTVRDSGFVRRTFLQVLIGLFAAVWIWAAILPHSRDDWALENFVVTFALAVLIVTYRKLPLSNFSYLTIAIFLTLHEVGAHYSYGRVPLGEWAQQTFHLTRNHYDRLVHFSFGLLLTYPFREVLIRLVKVPRRWSYFAALNIVLSLSAGYEIFEAYIALVAQPGLETAFLGTQGDVWDAQHDMAVAGAGSVLCMAITAFVGETPWFRRFSKFHKPTE